MGVNLKLKEVEIKETKTEVVNDYEAVNKYFWSSRSVYAVEFKLNIYPDSPMVINEFILIEVQFENNVINTFSRTFSDRHPIELKHFHAPSWAKELLSAFIQGDSYYDYRTKEQFDTDYNNVLQYYNKIRI